MGGAVENDGGLVSKYSLLIGLVICFRVLVYLKKLITSQLWKVHVIIMVVCFVIIFSINWA